MKVFYALGFVGFTAFSVRGQAALYAQCGGKGWTGATTCVSGAVCKYQNDYYSQCVAPTTTSCTTTPTTSATTTMTTTTTRASTSAKSTTSYSAKSPASTGKLKFAGVNIAGFDFGMDTNGDGSASSTYGPLPKYDGVDGPGQMAHFVNDDKYNTFRLPVAWQFLTDNAPTGTLNQAYFADYDTLVRACLATGAYCIIDIHNYARFNGQVIGQGGPSNEAFASLWASLAKYYAGESRMIFGIMNEPHGVDIALWAETVQAAVTAIRNAGATSQMILLSGNDYSSAKTFVSGGSANALSSVTNPDGSHTNLIFDVHRYLDYDGSGTSDTCVTNNADAWTALSDWLRGNGRQALNTETGGGNTASCEEYMCQQLEYMAENSDVILGYVGWAAGSFSATYVLSETPTKNGGTWVDQPLVTRCMSPATNNLLETTAAWSRLQR